MYYSFCFVSQVTVKTVKEYATDKRNTQKQSQTLIFTKPRAETHNQINIKISLLMSNIQRRYKKTRRIKTHQAEDSEVSIGTWKKHLK